MSEGRALGIAETKRMRQTSEHRFCLPDSTSADHNASLVQLLMTPNQVRHTASPASRCVIQHLSRSRSAIAFGEFRAQG